LTDGGRLTVDLDDKDEIALDIQPLPEKKGRNKAEEAAAS
jgi:ATP-dependent Clp protease ATP-binding subunit ClpA